MLTRSRSSPVLIPALLTITSSRPKRSTGGVDQQGDLLAVADIAGDESGGRSEAPGGLFALFAEDIGEDDRCPFGDHISAIACRCRGRRR